MKTCPTTRPTLQDQAWGFHHLRPRLSRSLPLGSIRNWMQSPSTSNKSMAALAHTKLMTNRGLADLKKTLMIDIHHLTCHNYKPTDLLVVHLVFLNQRVGWKDIYGPPNGFRWNGWQPRYAQLVQSNMCRTPTRWPNNSCTSVTPWPAIYLSIHLSVNLYNLILSYLSIYSICIKYTHHSWVPLSWLPISFLISWNPIRPIRPIHPML